MDEPAMEQTNEVDRSTVKRVSLRKFLEEYPVGAVVKIEDYIAEGTALKASPQLNLFCDQDCQGSRRFDGRWQAADWTGTDKVARDFLIYTCRDCGVTTKTYCILSQRNAGEMFGTAIKVGEFPELHIDVPSYLPTLLGDEYRYFIKGLKSEKAGLGIGAFGYYRRVVENQKGRIFKAMSDAARKLQLDVSTQDAFEKASKESQFKKALEDVSSFIPDAFKVQGHFPMKVLHSVLSEGIHGLTDEECLGIAHDIRVLLQDMSQRLKDALREDADARKSLSNLMKLHAAKNTN